MVANKLAVDFVYNKQDLLIPNPLTDKEAYEKALGNRPKKETIN